MLFWIEIDGDRVAVQAVNRKPKPYWRLAPYTIVYPTPKQRMVRDTVTIAAHMAVDGTQEDINLNVRDAFRGWEYTPQHPNKTSIANDNLQEFLKRNIDPCFAIQLYTFKYCLCLTNLLQHIIRYFN